MRLDKLGAMRPLTMLTVALVACSAPPPAPAVDAAVVDAAMEPSTHPLCGLWRISLYCLGGCYPDTEPERQTHMRITTTAVELGACTEQQACTWRYRAPIALDDDCLEHVRFADVPDDGVQLLNVCPHNPPWASATMLWQINGRDVVAEVLGQQLDDCQ